MPKTETIAADAWIQAILPLLEQGYTFQIEPQGMSMFPFLISDRDSVILEQIHGELKPLDIVLFRRANGTYILHRIIRFKKSGYDIVGDNETNIEHGVQREQIVAKATAMIRNGKEISCDQFVYRCLSRVWLILLPFRPFLVRIRTGIYQKFHF